MKKTFLYNFLFLLYIELVFHIACFHQLGFMAFFLIFFSSIIFGGLLTFLCSLSKKERLNGFLMHSIWVTLIIIFCAEFIYYSIYESFFGINGLFYFTVVKDGYDKILATVLQNIVVILILFIPILFIFIKLPKKNPRFNKIDSAIVGLFMVACFSYIAFNIAFLKANKDYSLYDLVFNVNMPVLNVKSFGLINSTFISVNKKFLGFKDVNAKSEDVLTNQPTVLSSNIKKTYNIDESIDFDKLIETESNKSIVEMHDYFKNQTPTTQNEFTGMFKDKNVIFILAESLDDIAIHEELTPTLYKMKNEGIKFENYYSPKFPGSTSDGEYMLEWGILPIVGEYYSLIDMVYGSRPYLLPVVLKEQGYKTYVYHNYAGYYNRRKDYFSTLNFDGYRYCGEGIETRCDHFHGSDLDMALQSVDDYLNDDKFFAYYITLSAHGSYDSSNFVAQKHISKLNNYNYPSSLKYFIAANIDFDLMMETLIKKLEEKNKLKDTVFVISSDHTPYYMTTAEMSLLSPYDRGDKFDRNRATLIIYNSELKEKYNIDKYAFNLDVLPTVLNMLDIKYDSRLIIGKDIMANNNDGLVILPDRSWINKFGSYDASSGNFKKFTDEVDDKYIEKINSDINSKFSISANMQYNDYYKYVFE